MRWADKSVAKPSQVKTRQVKAKAKEKAKVKVKEIAKAKDISDTSYIWGHSSAHIGMKWLNVA